ncbi:hypothetical protein Y1Q_0013241 [Alligator mississippiensis]|uniref:ribonuclease H n=1 Tax=Alligator mississippiensis TaxID=8496 RepID=A0A151NU85_ALLMI|nr:hypothetical protein Y1Q_0013241 [Alligator mississippiensis]
MDPAIALMFMKAQNVPSTPWPKIDAELDRLIMQGVLEPIIHTSWATPITPVLKPNGSVHICGDFKCTVNKVLKQDLHPVPTINQLLSVLSGGKIFAKLDLVQAYQQLIVDDKAAEAQTIITHWGAFCVKHLQFEISVAPGIFQWLMEEMPAGIPGVVPYFDDALIMGLSREKLTKRFRKVLQRFDKAGIRVKREKCQLGVSSINLLGYQIDVSGIRSVKDKVKAIHDAPIPTCRQDLQAFLGLLNFYHIFLKDRVTIAEPLHRLLDKGAQWKWTYQHNGAFQGIKRLLTSDSVLVHYDEQKPLSITCDASGFGVGAVLSHTLPDGTDAPIAFYLKTVT